MFQWLHNLMTRLLIPSYPIETSVMSEAEPTYPTTIEVEGTIFRRTRRTGGDRDFRYWNYYCPQCGDKLVDGPEGGMAVNAVCVKCQVNYGCLPWFDNPCHNF